MTDSEPSAPLFHETGYDPAARVYDLEYPDCTGDELAFWSTTAADVGSRLLELGCGSGRVAVALARLGFDVTGLDTSGEMLAAAARKRASLAPEVAERLHFMRADMRSFDINREFDLVFAVFNSYLLLPDASARAACLRSSLRHLRPGGMLAVDVFAADALDRQPDHERVEFLETGPEDGRRITRERFYSYDPDSGRGRSTLIYRLYADDGSIEERRLGYSLALLGRDDLVADFAAQRLAVEGVFGTYRRDKWSSKSPNLIVVGRKPGR